MRITFILTLLAIPCMLFSQGNTDIWLLRVDMMNEKINLSQPQNITARKGYDNQPCFSPDNRKIYFSSSPQGLNQVDIYTYDLSTKQLERFNFSKTSEFSPAIVPGGRGISVVMVEEDSTQRIWEFDLTGKKSRNIFPFNDSVGYYAWININSVIAYILGSGKDQPNRLSVIHRDGREKQIARNVERGMKIFGKGAFFLKVEDSAYHICHTDYTTYKKLGMAPGKSRDMTILQNHIMMAYEGIVYAAKIEMTNNKVTGLSPFVPVADLSGYGMKNLQRLTVSADGRWLAVVNAD